MKRKISLIGAYVVTILILCLGLIAFASCDKWHKSDSPVPTEDSILVQQCVDQYFNPVFTDVESVLEFKKQISEKERADSFITAASPDMLRNITTVLLKRNEPVTLYSILTEYLANKNLYDNLPSNATPPITDNATPTVTEEQHRLVDSCSMKQKSITYKDTMINGKKCRVETKISEYE